MRHRDHEASASQSLLEAAQRLFAQEGFDKVSMRALTQEAGVNLAAVNYHFGSKQGLIDAVVSGYVNPVNEERLRLLDAAEEAGAVTLERILDCFMRPVLEAVHRSAISEKLFFQLMGRCMNAQSIKTMPESVMGLFEQVVMRYPRAIRAVLPEVDAREILWRLHFTVGVMIHVLIHTEGLLHIAKAMLGRPSLEEILTMAKGYCVAGLAAPGAMGITSSEEGGLV